MNPVQIVDALIDTPAMARVCAACEKEIGPVDTGYSKKSHGLCRRHYIEQLRQEVMPINKEKAEELIVKAEAAPEEYFCPDLAKTPSQA